MLIARRAALAAAPLAVALWVAVLALPVAAGQPPGRKITDAEVGAVAQAIEDEIYNDSYDSNYYRYGERIDMPSGGTAHRIHLHINPDIVDGRGEAIYELLPFGEVFRSFTIRKDGFVILAGDPESGFPKGDPHGQKTLWMNDADVCKMKSDWLRSSFDVEMNPSPQRIEDAARRQRHPTGSSNSLGRLFPRHHH